MSMYQGTVQEYEYEYAPAIILRKSILSRYQPVKILGRYRVKHNASWDTIYFLGWGFVRV